jgi:hypothetical protein
MPYHKGSKSRQCKDIDKTVLEFDKQFFVILRVFEPL